MNFSKVFRDLRVFCRAAFRRNQLVGDPKFFLNLTSFVQLECPQTW